MSDVSAARRAFRMQQILQRPDVSYDKDAEILVRPGELLVANEDLQRTMTELDALGIPAELAPPPVDDLPEPFPITKLLISRGHNIAAVVRALRKAGGPELRVGPNHVMVATETTGLVTTENRGNISVGPETFAQAATPPVVPGRAGDGKGVNVAVLDTGLALRGGGPEHPLLSGRCSVLDPRRDDEERDANPRDGYLDDASGHGTFIAGIIRQIAPGATITAAQVIDSNGIGDEDRIARSINTIYRRLNPKPDIINLSLGANTLDDRPPVAFDPVMRSIDRARTVIVAAAGNGRGMQPFYPAALDGVIAVAALDFGGDAAPGLRSRRGTRADYSNYGPWVDACAAGDWISTFFMSASDRRHVLRPSVSVPSRTFTGWARWSGTSFATPAVAGAIAATMTRHGLSAPAAVSRLMSRAGVTTITYCGAFVDVLSL